MRLAKNRMYHDLSYSVEYVTSTVLYIHEKKPFRVLLQISSRVPRRTSGWEARRTCARPGRQTLWRPARTG